MMKVLFTGMGSHHCKSPANTSFFSLLADEISSFADVVWMSPNINWTAEDLDQFDHVVFGLLPPTSISANKIYGALNVLNELFASKKITLVLDSPQIWQYKNSINAVARDYRILLGSYYSKRESHEAANSKQQMLKQVSEKLSSDSWPRIMYPKLPWNSDSKIREAMGFASSCELIGVNLDASLIGTGNVNFSRSDVWAAENIKSSWLSYIAKSISLPMQSTKLGRSTDDTYANDVISNGIGLLLPPQERTNLTWWNYRLIQALNSSTPVITYWQDTHEFHPSWGTLAYQVEDMSPAQRQRLSTEQRESYLAAIDDNATVVKLLKNLMINSEKESK